MADLSYQRDLLAEEAALDPPQGSTLRHPTLRKGIVTGVGPLAVDGLPAGNITGLVLRAEDVVWMTVDAGRRLVVGKTSLAEGAEVELAYTRTSSWTDLLVPAPLVGSFSRYRLTLRNPTAADFAVAAVGMRLNGEGLSGTDHRYSYLEHQAGVITTGSTAPLWEASAPVAKIGHVGTLGGSTVEVDIIPYDQRHTGLTAVALTWFARTFRNASGASGVGSGQAQGRWNPTGSPSLTQVRVGRISNPSTGAVTVWEADCDYTLTGLFGRS